MQVLCTLPWSLCDTRLPWVLFRGWEDGSMGTEIEFCLKHNSRPAAGSGENEDKKTGQVYLEVYCNCSTWWHEWCVQKLFSNHDKPIGGTRYPYGESIWITPKLDIAGSGGSLGVREACASCQTCRVHSWNLIEFWWILMKCKCVDDTENAHASGGAGQKNVSTPASAGEEDGLGAHSGKSCHKPMPLDIQSPP